MQREAYSKLINWKNTPHKKPLLMQGARQVGKTHLVKEFGKNEFEELYYFNFEKDAGLSSLFESSLDPENIITSLSLYIGKKIDSKNSLIFFDEIQVAPRALTSLKYFQENAPQFSIIAAGSLLGVSVGKETSFPVGKVDFLSLYPLSFNEYLLAAGEELFADMIKERKITEAFPEAIHKKMTDHLKLYLYLGGMPEVVSDYLQTKDIEHVRELQKNILQAYENDFSKYADKNQAIKNSELWGSIPKQLAKENKKFKYKEIKKNARSNMYELAIEWLRKAGLIIIVKNIETPKIPLSSYVNEAKFKVYMHDVGLLAAKLKITPDQIVSPDALYKGFNGAFIENFVAQELIADGTEELYYWTSRSDAEVDFLLDNENMIIPVEVKSGTSLAMKSLQSYAAKYNPDRILRVSPRNFIQSDKFINIPLYAIKAFRNITYPSARA